MALTITHLVRPLNEGVQGAVVRGVCRVQFDSTYPAGGESFAAADVGLTSFISVAATPTTNLNATTTDFVTWVAATSKLMAFEGNGAATPLNEEATADISALIVDVTYLGRF